MQALTTSEAAASIASSLGSVAKGLESFSTRAGEGLQQLGASFPGPLAEATLGYVRGQVGDWVEGAVM